MKGAIVFLIVFVIVFLVSLAVTWLPPGQYLYNILNLPVQTTTYKLGGLIFGDVLIKAIFNGVIYAFIVWLIFTIANYMSKNKPATVHSH